MGKNTINEQLMRFVKGACGGTTGNPGCNKRVMSGSVCSCSVCCITY
jgi:hypothetical protein